MPSSSIGDIAWALWSWCELANHGSPFQNVVDLTVLLPLTGFDMARLNAQTYVIHPSLGLPEEHAVPAMFVSLLRVLFRMGIKSDRSR